VTDVYRMGLIAPIWFFPEDSADDSACVQGFGSPRGWHHPRRGVRRAGSVITS